MDPLHRVTSDSTENTVSVLGIDEADNIEFRITISRIGRT